MGRDNSFIWRDQVRNLYQYDSIFYFWRYNTHGSFSIWNKTANIETIANRLEQNPIFDYHNLGYLNNFLILLFFWYQDSIPLFFKRVIMAKNTSQVSRSFIISRVVIFSVSNLMFYFIGLMLPVDKSS